MKIRHFILQYTFLILQCSMAQGCQKGHDLNEVHSGLEVKPPRRADDWENRLSYMESICTATKGKWLHCLRACDCSEGRLLSASTGCIDIAKIPQDGVNGFHRVGALSVSFPEGGQLNDLRGITIDASTVADNTIAISVHELKARHIEAGLRPVGYAPLESELIHFPPTKLRGSSLSEGKNKCAKLFDGIGFEESLLLQQLCTDLWDTIEQIVDGSICMSTPQVMKHKGVSTERTEISFLYRHTNTEQLSYHTIGLPEMPMVRILRLHQPNGFSMEALISPLGELFGGRATMNQILSDAEPNLVHQQVIYFDGRMEVLRFDDERLGRRGSLVEAAQAILAQEPNTIVLHTDGKRPTLLKPVNGMFMESGIHLSATSMMSRMNLAFEAISRIAQVGDFSLPVFSDEISDDRSILDLICGLKEDCNHGTGVASLMARDLPFCRLTLFPIAGRDTGFPEESLLREAIIRKISLEQPRVVNISFDFFAEIRQCDAFFGPIFDHFRESVLFVVGAGNDSDGDPKDICPGGLAHAYENALSVGGVDEEGLLHPWSNFGSDLVDIAAPYCNQVLDGGNRVGSEKLHQQCGTSFSSPLVANAALRLFALAPHLKPSEVKSILMASCEAKNIDVACGGQLDLQQLGRVETHLMAKMQNHPLVTPRIHPLEEIHKAQHFSSDIPFVFNRNINHCALK